MRCSCGKPRRCPRPRTSCARWRADLGAAPGEVYLGARATEAQVKRLSQTGELAHYRMVTAPPMARLRARCGAPPSRAYCSRRRIRLAKRTTAISPLRKFAGLKLDADWVGVSACNTAAGGAQGAEALSGLARAFIYAQARALLVSHWEVNSEATVKLVTGAMKRLAADKGLGRAEAMRQLMLALMDNGTPRKRIRPIGRRSWSWARAVPRDDLLPLLSGMSALRTNKNPAPSDAPISHRGLTGRRGGRLDSYL